MNLSLAYTCCMDGLLKLWSRFGFVLEISKDFHSCWDSKLCFYRGFQTGWKISIGLALQHHSWLWRCWAQKFKRDWAGATWSELALGEVGKAPFWEISFLPCLLKCSAPAADVDNDQLSWCLWWVFDINFVHSLKSTRPCLLNAGRTHFSLFMMPSNMLACPTTCGSAYHLCTNQICWTSFYNPLPPVLVRKTSPSFICWECGFQFPLELLYHVYTAEWTVRHPVVVPTFMSPFQISALALGVQPAVEFLFTQLPRDQKIVSIYMSVTCPNSFNKKLNIKNIVILCPSIRYKLQCCLCFWWMNVPILEGCRLASRKSSVTTSLNVSVKPRWRRPCHTGGAPSGMEGWWGKLLCFGLLKHHHVWWYMANSVKKREMV